MFNWLVDFSLRKPLLVIIASILVFAGFASQLLNLEIDGRTEALVPEHNPHVTLRNQMEEIFGAGNFIIISVAEADAFTKPILKRAYDVSETLSQSESVKEVHSIFSKQYLKGGDGVFEVGDIVENAASGEFDIESIKSHLSTDPVYKGNLTSLDANGFALIVEFVRGTTDQQATELVESVLAQADLQNQWPIAGLPVIQHEIKRYMDRDMAVLMPIFLAALAALLFFSFRTGRGVLVPFAPILLAIVASLGFMSINGIKITMITNLVPMLIIAVGSSYSIHFLNQYYREISATEKQDKLAILKAAGIHITPILVLASVTTFLGFLSNIFNPIIAIREFAVTLAFSVLVLLIANLTLQPAILSLLKPVTTISQGRAEGWFNRGMDYLLAGFARLVIKLRWTVLIFSVALIGASIYFVSQVKVESSGLSFFKDDSSLVKSSREISQSFGGVVGFNFVIDTGVADGAKSPAVLHTLADFKDWLETKHSKNIKVSMSLADYVKQMSSAYNGSSTYHRIPETLGEVAQYIEIFGWSADIDESLRTVVDSDFRYLNFSGRFALIEYPDGSYKEESLQNQKKIIDAATAWLMEHLPAGVTAKPYGDIMVVSDINESIIEGQILSLILALGCVLAVTTIVFRSIIGGLISLIPVALAITMSFGFMGLFSIPLNIATALVSAMAIGIGIDDTIHFMLTYRNRIRANGNFDISYRETLLSSGRAIIYTSVALMGGYLILMASSFTPIVYFGILNIITILFATLGALVMLGAVVIIVKPGFFLRGYSIREVDSKPDVSVEQHVQGA